MNALSGDVKEGLSALSGEVKILLSALSGDVKVLLSALSGEVKVLLSALSGDVAAQCTQSFWSHFSGIVSPLSGGPHLFPHLKPLFIFSSSNFLFTCFAS